MAPFEVLYKHRCRTLLNWIDPREKAICGPDLIDEAEVTVRCIQDNLKAMRSRQESYAKKRRRPLEFEVGDHVYLRVSLMKGMKRFGIKEKLAPRHIGPFPILEKCGPVAYKLELPPSLAGVHDIFHVSQLKKFLKAPVDVVLLEVTPLEADLTYPEHPIKILDQKARVTRRKTIKFFKVQCSKIQKKKLIRKVRTSSVLAIQSSNYRREETCDCSLLLLELFLHYKSWVEISFKGEDCDTLVSL
jgi:hypothetical protein